MRVYVAASSRELSLAAELMTALETRAERDFAPGSRIEIASTWPETIRSVGVANPTDVAPSARRAWARRQCDEVRSADLFWLLYPAPPITGWADAVTPIRGAAPVSFGAAFEFALANAHGIPSVVSGLAQRQTIFTAMATHALDDHEAALDWILAIALPTWNRARRIAIGSAPVFRTRIEALTAAANDRPVRE